MKSTNLYSGLAIILAAAANTAVVGCAGVDAREDAIDAESSVRSVSSPCNDARSDPGASAEQPAEGNAPCNGGNAVHNNAGQQQG